MEPCLVYRFSFFDQYTCRHVGLGSDRNPKHRRNQRMLLMFPGLFVPGELVSSSMGHSAMKTLLLFGVPDSIFGFSSILWIDTSSRSSRIQPRPGSDASRRYLAVGRFRGGDVQRILMGGEIIHQDISEYNCILDIYINSIFKMYIYIYNIYFTHVYSKQYLIV